MSSEIKEKVDKLIETTQALGGVGCLIVEQENELVATVASAREVLAAQKYVESADYVEIMDVLSAGQDKIFYAEQGEKLDGLVLEIIAEFEAGLVSLADRKNNMGLKTANWNPAKVSLIIVMTRNQIEQSYPRLFESITLTQSI